MQEKNKKFSQEELCKMMPELNPERQLPIGKYITKIPREQYQELDRFFFYAYYYEEKGKNDNKKYKVYVIGEKERGSKNEMFL